MYDIPYTWNLKRNDTNELTYKTERLTDLENKFTVTCTHYYTAHAALLNVTWQPRWEGSLGENEYMYMYD